MKPRLIHVLIIVVVLLVGLPNLATAQDELEGLQVVKILIEGLSKDAADEQITRQMLEDQVLVTIRSKAPNLRVDSKASVSIYVNLTFRTTSSGYVGFLSVALQRPVEVLVGTDTAGQSPAKRVWTIAPVWDTGTLFTGGRSGAIDHMRSVLERLLEEFLAAYYRTNK